MKLLENKGICILLMLVLMAGGFWLGGYKGLSGQYSKVEDVFFVGEDGDGICVANDLNERVTAAQNLVTIASNYAGVSDARKAVSDAAAALSSNLQSSDVAAIIESNRQLDTAMTALYNDLGQESLSQNHEKYRQSLYANFNSRGDIISHDPYNNYAQEYNQLLKGFPASLLVAITPAHEAVIFY